jgi:hypothetical protein
MKKQNLVTFFALVAMLALALASGCKSSGMAVTGRGQVMAVNISGADDLPDGTADTLKISVDNRGLANISNVEYTVEIPNELVVVSEKHGDGIELMEMRTPTGTKLYHYMAGDIEAASSAKSEFEVRTAFGSLDRTGDIKVTAWQKDLQGDKLVETKQIKLRR